MVDKSRRKELLQQYEERKPSVGVYVVRNSATGEAWVGASRNVDKQKNGLWFSFNLGSSPNLDVQASWKTSGEAAFSYEILEVLEETDPHVIERLLPERATHWREKLGAGTIRGI